jgi:hypothetical protein
MRKFIPFPHKIESNAGIINMQHLQTLNGPFCQGGHLRANQFVETGNVLCLHCNTEQDGWRIDPAYLDDGEFAHRFFDQAGVTGNMNCYPGIPGGSCRDTCAIHVDLISQSLGQILRRHLRSCGRITRHFIIIGFTLDSLQQAARSNLFQSIREMYELTHPGDFTFEFRNGDGTQVLL